MAFASELIRLWRQPVAGMLSGGLGTLPLAPLGQLPPGVTLEEGLPDVIRQIAERLTTEASPEEAAKLWTTTFVLTGMRVTREALVQLFQGVREMHESVAYQIILDEGRAEGQVQGVRKILFRQGHKRFGPAGADIEQAIQAITDLEHLERLADRLLDVASWQELLNTP
jgi:hypothetical protein